MPSAECRPRTSHYTRRDPEIAKAAWDAGVPARPSLSCRRSSRFRRPCCSREKAQEEGTWRSCRHLLRCSDFRGARLRLTNKHDANANQDDAYPAARRNALMQKDHGKKRKQRIAKRARRHDVTVI